MVCLLKRSEVTGGAMGTNGDSPDIEQHAQGRAVLHPLQAAFLPHRHGPLLERVSGEGRLPGAAPSSLTPPTSGRREVSLPFQTFGVGFSSVK